MFKDLLRYYLEYFQQHGENALLTICNCDVPSGVILSEYKKLPKIETLPEEEKKDLWKYSKEKYPNGNSETRLRFIRITYTIGNLL